MKKIVLTFGLISGVLTSLMMIATLPFLHNLDGIKGWVLGYTTMVLAFLLVYFGIRSYRDNVGNGQITFGKGFAIGILITLIMCAFYVVTWEIIYFNFMSHSMDSYFAHMIDKAKAAGDSAGVAKAQLAKERYANPFFNAAYTFIEPFPLGLLITLISAAILRKKEPSQPAQESLATA